MATPPGSPPLPPLFQINLPPEQIEGHYADFATIWHNQETFIIDFVAMESPPAPGQDPAGNPVAAVACRVVTRVRIPAAQVWEVMKGLENQLTQYETENPHRKSPPPTA